MPLSEVAEIDPVLVPPLRVNTTVDPPAVKWFPLASMACKVSVEAEPELIVAEETLTNDCDNDRAPGFTVTVGKVEVTDEALIVALMVVDVPAVIPVKVAV